MFRRPSIPNVCSQFLFPSCFLHIRCSIEMWNGIHNEIHDTRGRIVLNSTKRYRVLFFDSIVCSAIFFKAVCKIAGFNWGAPCEQAGPRTAVLIIQAILPILINRIFVHKTFIWCKFVDTSGADGGRGYLKEKLHGIETRIIEKKTESNETPTWCNTVQVLFLQGHSTCFKYSWWWALAPETCRVTLQK